VENGNAQVSQNIFRELKCFSFWFAPRGQATQSVTIIVARITHVPFETIAVPVFPARAATIAVSNLAVGLDIVKIVFFEYAMILCLFCFQ